MHIKNQNLITTQDMEKILCIFYPYLYLHNTTFISSEVCMMENLSLPKLQHHMINYVKKNEERAGKVKIKSLFYHAKGSKDEHF